MAPRSDDPGMKPGMHAEVQVLLCCARSVIEAGEHEHLRRLLDAGIDWARVVDMAQRHGLLPLLYRHLNALPDAAIPRAVLVELWGRHEATTRRNHARTWELLRILRLFDENGIDALPYKGPALAASLYGDVALREFGDLDILLRPRDVLPAKTALRSLGYRAEYPLEPAIEMAFLRSSAQYHLAMEHAEHGLVELHWKTNPDFPVERDDDGWWASLEQVPLEGGRVRSLSDTELLLVLCLHGTKHHWDCLGWLVDVAELIRRQSRLDWNWMFDKAARLGCERRVLLGLHLAQHLLDAPVPQEIRARIAARPEVEPLAGRIVATLFVAGFEGMRPLERLRFNLSLYERTRQRIAHCVDTLWSPGLVEWTRWPLPRALFFLYPPLRLMRLTRKYFLR